MEDSGTAITYYMIGTPCTSIFSSCGDGRGAKPCKCGGVSRDMTKFCCWNDKRMCSSLR